MPPQLFMASIGSCVGVLVTHFCKEHHLDATDLQVHVDYDVADHPTRFHNIQVKISLPHAVCDDACTRKALEQVGLRNGKLIGIDQLRGDPHLEMHARGG